MLVKLIRICLQVLNSGIDAVIYVYHRKCCVLFKPALVVSILKSVEKDLRRVVCRAIEGIFLAADDARIS